MNEAGLNEARFGEIAEELMMTIEEAVEDTGVDIDIEANHGVLTLTMEANGSVVIVSRQSALLQIWVAAKSGGFHLDLVDDQWICSTTKETLQELLSRTCTEQSGEAVNIDF
jgi:CyaY protein